MMISTAENATWIQASGHLRLSSRSCMFETSDGGVLLSNFQGCGKIYHACSWNSAKKDLAKKRKGLKTSPPPQNESKFLYIYKTFITKFAVYTRTRVGIFSKCVTNWDVILLKIYPNVNTYACIFPIIGVHF